MGKRKGTMISLVSLFFVAVLTTLFFYMVYSMHYDSVSDDFTGFHVEFDNGGREPDSKSDPDLGSVREDLTSWASENDAVIFYKGFSTQGIAAADYAGWFRDTLGIAFDGLETKTAIVQKNKGFNNYYIEGDILFPGTYNYRIVGEFEDRNAPTFQGDAFYYYPLSDVSVMYGRMFTDVRDEYALIELMTILENNGIHVEYLTYGDAGLGVITVIKRMLTDDWVSSSMLFAFAGLVFCGVFAVHMLYRESGRYMAVHRLYGATYISLYFRLLVKLIMIAASGTLIGYIFGRTQLYLIHRTAYMDAALLSGLCIILFFCQVNTACFIKWCSSNRKKEGHY